MSRRTAWRATSVMRTSLTAHPLALKFRHRDASPLSRLLKSYCRPTVLLYLMDKNDYRCFSPCEIAGRVQPRSVGHRALICYFNESSPSSSQPR
jgi:hypothetical protein